MKNFVLLVVSSILTLSSCSDNKDVYDSNVANQIANANAIPNVNIAEVSNFKMTQKYNVPVQAGKVTVITKGNDTLAITDHAITVNIPKTASVVYQVSSNAKTRGTSLEDADIDKIVVQYKDIDSLTGYTLGTATIKEETVMMFEDSPVNCDYDYNDIVLLVKCRTTEKDDSCTVDVAVKPLAYGAKYNIKFGFDYSSVSTTTGSTTTIASSKGIVLSNNVKKDFFDNREVNTTGTYSSVIPLKDYTIANPFTPTILQLGDESKTVACVKYDRKSEQKEDIVDKTKTINTFKNEQEGFYQFAPIKVKAGKDSIKFFIAPEIPLTYVKNSTYVLNGKTLSGNIKYTSTFTYKLYAGDCNLKESSLIPYGIAIPLTSLKNDKGEDHTYIYWPYESQPIWEGFPKFENWLSSNNNENDSWINYLNESDSIKYGDQTWNASLLVRGASYSEMKLPDVESYAKEVDATQKSQESKKVNQTVNNAEVQ